MIQQIGQYRIVRVLGGGGMGVVYRALDTDVGREVALKRLRSEFAASPEVLDRFRNEARLQGRMNHPNIAQLYSLVQTQDAFCIVMELVEGVVIKDLMPMPWTTVVVVMEQVLEALGYAHSLHVLHRDIKPENILIDQRGMVKVMDFGIAHAIGSQRMTREKSIVGTIEYMPPERILNRPMDERSDIYSLGILLFEMLSGRLPFDATGEYDILRWQVEGTAPLVSAVAAVPQFFDEICARATCKDPDDRYVSCAEMMNDIRALAGNLDGAADSLREAVTHQLAMNREATFDATGCYVRVAEEIGAGDLSAAEKVLDREVHRFPQEQQLRRYLSIVSRARMEAAETPEEQEGILRWMKMIAAVRCNDRKAYAQELERSARELPGFTIPRLLQVHGQRV